MAKKFEKQGAKMLHVVDLDAAKIGWPVNLELVIKIAKTINIPVEVGGDSRRGYDKKISRLRNCASSSVLKQSWSPGLSRV